MQIERAVEHFRALLEEQEARARRLEADESASGGEHRDKTVIGVVGGDGIGPVIMAQARRVLEYLLADEIAAGTAELRQIDGLTIENRLACGEAVPAGVLEEIRACDALLKGPTTTPKGGTLESANVTLRRALDLYANVRPVRIPPKAWTGRSSAKIPRASIRSAAAVSSCPGWRWTLRSSPTPARAASPAPPLNTRAKMARSAWPSSPRPTS